MREVNNKNVILNNTSFIKVILMLFVMLGHSMALWWVTWLRPMQVVPESSVINLLYGWLNSFHTYAFTAISGYIFAYKMSRDGYDNVPGLLKVKAKRLLVPYLFVSLCWVIPVSVFWCKWDVQQEFTKFLLGTAPNQLWFLWMLFDVFVISWLLWKPLSNSNALIGTGICLGLYIVGTAGHALGEDYYCIWFACQYVVFFFIGIRLYRAERQQSGLDGRLFNKLFRTSMIPLWILADMCLYFLHLLLDGIDGMLKCADTVVVFLLHVVGACGAILILNTISMKLNKGTVLTKFSKYTMPMYLFHQQVIYFTLITLNGKVNPYLLVAVNLLAALGCSFIISFVLMQWKFTRMLIGEKS